MSRIKYLLIDVQYIYNKRNESEKAYTEDGNRNFTLCRHF